MLKTPPEDKYDFRDSVINREQAPRSLSEKAYDEIRRKIVSLELPPGGILDESVLQRELDLGRTPIREALLRLSLEKLVTIVPRRGMFVSDIFITDLQRLFEMRLVLENLAVRLAVQRGTDDHWARMDEILSRISIDDPSIDNEALIVADELCHLILYQATDNKFLQDTLRTTYALSLRLWYYFLGKIGDMHEGILEHKAILAALRKRDESLAGELMDKHIKAFQEEIQTVMLGAPSPFNKHH